MYRSNERTFYSMDYRSLKERRDNDKTNRIDFFTIMVGCRILFNPPRNFILEEGDISSYKKRVVE